MVLAPMYFDNICSGVDVEINRSPSELMIQYLLCLMMVFGQLN